MKSIPLFLWACLWGSVTWPAAAAAAAAENPPRRVFTATGQPADDSFFPIAVWLQDPRNAPRFQAAGINLYVGLWQGPTESQLSALNRIGMPVVCAQNATGLAHRDDPIIAGWMHGDEPDNAQSLPGGQGYGPPILPEGIVKDYQQLRATDPTRPVLLNLGQGVAYDNYIGRGVRRNKPEDYPEYVRGCDIASFDIYPVAHDSPEVSGKLEFVARGVERLVRWTDGKKPVWSCIECTAIDGQGRKATPAQVRSEVWMALIRGARGLIYFVHQFKPDFQEAALLNDPEMLAAVTAINREIKTLAPVLNSAAVREVLTVSGPPDGAIAATVRRHEGTTHVFAVNLTPQPVTATFTLTGSTPATLSVPGTERTITVNNGAFADDFGPYQATHFRLNP